MRIMYIRKGSIILKFKIIAPPRTKASEKMEQLCEQLHGLLDTLLKDPVDRYFGTTLGLLIPTFKGATLTELCSFLCNRRIFSRSSTL